MFLESVNSAAVNTIGRQLIPIINNSVMSDIRKPVGNRTLRTQDTSVPRHFGTSAEVSRRHFGTGAEVSGQFGPKTLRHQDISALMRGHLGTTAERRYRETIFKDIQGHRYYIGGRGHPRSPAMSPLSRVRTISYILY